MLVGVGAAQLVDELHVLFDRVRPAVEELVLVDRAVRAPLAGGAVVGGVHDDGVLELPGVLQVLDDAADLSVGVLGEAGVDLGQAGEELLLVRVELVPGAHRVAGILTGLAGSGLIGVSWVSAGSSPFSIMRGRTHSR